MNANNRKRLGALLCASLIAVPTSWCKIANSRPPLEYRSDESELPLVQQLEVRQLATLRIAFKVSSRQGSGHVYSVAGIAVREPDHVDQNAEVDDDGDRPAYFVDAYTFTRGECSLEIRIESEGKGRATIFESGCGALHPKAAPFETPGVLRTGKGTQARANRSRMAKPS